MARPNAWEGTSRPDLRPTPPPRANTLDEALVLAELPATTDEIARKLRRDLSSIHGKLAKLRIDGRVASRLVKLHRARNGVCVWYAPGTPEELVASVIARTDTKLNRFQPQVAKR